MGPFLTSASRVMPLISISRLTEFDAKDEANFN